MKKMLTFALCLAAVGTMSAQKASVDQAAKLSGKLDKLGEARALIDQSAADPETMNDVRTYYVGGKLEFDAYDKALQKKMINPNDESANPIEMGQQLLRGYEMFMKALPLDSVPNEKGEVKPKNSKDIASKLNGHYSDYFNAGGTFYNEKKYFPEAYEAFMIYGTMPDAPFADKNVKATADTIVNTSFFNAGISAYAGNALPEAIMAFKAARLNGTNNPQNYVYELACWQYLAQKDSTIEDTAKAAIEEIAMAGHQKFGMTQPLFLNNLVNSLVQANKGADALLLVNEQIAANPEMASLYGLRGYINDRMDNDDASIEDYRKAASFADADFETLKNASKKIFKTGTMKYNELDGASADKRNDVKVNYFEAAKSIAERAQQLNANDSDLDYVLESINYALETYFK
ncbi:MAG: hypothetical protein HDS24_01775 [Bacteroides sp.]|nr:hypothetical protein [Bacteroides sp.]